MIDNLERSKRRVLPVSRSWQRSSVYQNLNLYLKANLYKFFHPGFFPFALLLPSPKQRKLEFDLQKELYYFLLQGKKHNPFCLLSLLYSNCTPLTSRTRSDTDLIHRWLLSTKTCLLPDFTRSEVQLPRKS